MVLWCGHAVPPFPSCDLVLFPSIGSVAALALVGVFLASFFFHFVLFFLFWNTLAMGMVAMLWFWNFSGVFLPSLRFDLSGLGVGVPSLGPELSLDWLDPFSFLCFSAFGLTSSSWLLGFPAPIFFRCAWQVLSFFLFWFALPFNLQGSSLGSCFILSVEV